MNDIPLSEATMSEVLARVTFRLIERAWKRCHIRAWSATDVMCDLALRLEDAGYETLSTWVYAYRMRWTPIYTCDLIKQQMLLDARRGNTWRRTAYPPYKRNRRDPRVTNRGVAGGDYLGEV